MAAPFTRMAPPARADTALHPGGIAAADRAELAGCAVKCDSPSGQAQSGACRRPVVNPAQSTEIVMSPQKDTKKSGKTITAIDKKVKGFTDEERAAMKERAQELKAETRRGPGTKKSKTDGESDVLARIAAMPEPDRTMAARIHAIIKASAPALSPKTWYGMPAYARDGNVVCFFQGAQKFNTRYATLGFSDKANLDEAAMWPVAFALKELTATEEARIVALVRRAAS